ncbi:unnamed protein product [Ceratitis capitata]|uniref:(Mediterranean fruit fly) hypothetical protein n=1 Tax=Ceratitis capitata TaxID=7213 RepID=A0A811VES9_CERCA|nr:unnamed protein product [Ceratitis capitata]
MATFLPTNQLTSQRTNVGTRLTAQLLGGWLSMSVNLVLHAVETTKDVLKRAKRVIRIVCILSLMLRKHPHSPGSWEAKRVKLKWYCVVKQLQFHFLATTDPTGSNQTRPRDQKSSKCKMGTNNQAGSVVGAPNNTSGRDRRKMLKDTIKENIFLTLRKF